jgi:hypothetical protein
MLALLLAANLARFTSFHGVVLEKTTLRGATALLGPAEIHDNGGQAHAHMYSICYRGSDGVTLAFNSHSEMGGAGHDLTGFQLVARPELADYSGDSEFVVREEGKPHCLASKIVSHASLIGGKLRLGMSATQAAKALGVPVDGRQLSANSETSAGGEFTTFRTVEVLVEQGRVVAIRVYQITCS